MGITFSNLDEIMGGVLSTPYHQKTTEEESESSDEEFYSNTSTPGEPNITDNQAHATDLFDMESLTKRLDKKGANFDLNTDAIGTATGPQRRRTSLKITIETVREIENELSFYEKASLVFILFENEDVALQWIIKESSNIVQCDETVNLIFEWAKTESKKSDSDSWKNKFLEALCVIQNYSMLQRLGYDKKEMQSRFLPSSFYTTLHISLQRKALYLICENLTMEETLIFRRHLKNAFRESSLHYVVFDDNYLEIYFLHCFSMKFITNTNFTNLINIFKKMHLEKFCDVLTFIGNKATENFVTTDEVKYETPEHSRFVNIAVNEKLPVRNYGAGYFDLKGKVNINSNSQAGSDHSVISDSSTISTRSLLPDDENYTIDTKNVGICLIINQEKFEKCQDSKIPNYMCALQKLYNRTGTIHDRNKLVSTFSQLGFTVLTKDNRSHSEMQQDIEEALKSFSEKESCFVLCILSHGEAGIVYGTDSVQVQVGDIENQLFKYTKLLGKPKVLIIQSCQGTPVQKALYPEVEAIETDGVTSSKKESNSVKRQFVQHVPQRSDLLVCWSTLPGFASVRSKNKGTWFVQELCDTILRDSEKTHLADLLVSVANRVSNKLWEPDGEPLCMVPKHESTLRKRLFLQILPATSHNQAGYDE